MTDLPAGIDQGALDAAATDVAVPEPQTEADVAVSPDPVVLAADDPPADYSGWLKADLVAEAESRGLDTTGTKDDLIARLTG